MSIRFDPFENLIHSLGYELSDSSEGSRIVTGSRIEFAPQITVAKFSTLGQQRENFSVLAYDLPLEAGVDGVLGLDFFRGLNLNIDFRNGLITLS